GVTVGNSFRRILLSSLPGTAVNAIKIEGVEHEYSSIDGVKEDVYEIILNLKEVRFEQIEKSSGIVHLSVSEEGTFTAGDIDEATADYEVLNPELVIATLSEDAELDIELHISRGRGYVPAEDQNIDTSEDVNIIPIDAKIGRASCRGRCMNYVRESGG